MDTSTRKWVIAVNLSIAAAVNYADRSALSTVLPALRSQMHLTDIELASFGSVFLWSYALFSPLSGLLADRWSRSRLVVLSIVSWSLVSVLAGLSVNYQTFVATRVLLGLTESLFLPSAIALIADYHGTSSLGTAMAIQSIGLNLGVVAGGAGTGYLADRFGWRLAFIILGIVGLLVAGISQFFLKDSDRQPPRRSPTSPLLASLKELSHIHCYLVVLAEVIFTALGVWIFFNWLPLYFRDTFHMSLGSAGFAGTFTLQIGQVIGMVLSGFLSDRLASSDRRYRMLLESLSFMASAPFLLVFLAHPSLTLVNLCIFIFALLRGMGQANDNPILCDVVPSHLRSTGVGFMNLCATFAGGFGILATGYSMREYGLTGVFSMMSIAFLLAGLIMLLGYRVFSVNVNERPT